MIETRCLKNVVILIQTILSFVLSRKNNNIYDWRFGFRQQYSTSQALINITENIRKDLNDGNIGCEVFVDLQNAFDIEDH